MRIKFFTLLTITCLAVCWLPATSVGDEIVIGNVTDVFGNNDGSASALDQPGLLFDEARTGGGDTAAQATFSPSRNLVTNPGTNDNWATGLPIGTPGTITFTGLGFAMRGGTTATQVDVTVSYLGADGVVGGSDDVVVGSVSDSLSYSSVNEYVWRFATPLVFDWDGADDRFRFELSTAGTGNLRFKQRSIGESPSGQGGITMSVGGSFTPIPEPSSMLVLGWAACGLMLRRKRSV